MHRKVKCKNKTDQNQELSVRDSFIGGGGGTKRGGNQIVNGFETPLKLTSDPTMILILTWLNALLHCSFKIEERHTSLVISFVYLIIHSFLSAFLH